MARVPQKVSLDLLGGAPTPFPCGGILRKAVSRCLFLSRKPDLLPIEGFLVLTYAPVDPHAPFPIHPLVHRDRLTMDHPLVSDLDRLLKGQLSPAETRTIVLHFLGGCPDCAEHFSADMLPDAPFPPPEDYDTLFDRLERSESGPWSDVPPALLWAELEPLTPARRVLALQNRRYRSPAFASWLTRHSRALAEDASPSAPLAAHVAVDVLTQLTHHAEISEGLGRELRVSALANLGNARRALGAFAGALEAFDQAERELGAGGAEHLTRLEFFSLRAGLYRDVGRFDEATADLRRAYLLGKNRADLHSNGLILLQLADVVGLDDPEEGLSILLTAAEKIDLLLEPRLELSLLHRRGWLLNDAGRPAGAMEVFRTTWPLYARSLEPRVKGMRNWLWARIERSFGDVIQAEIHLSRAVELFRELGAAHDHAISGLDLADVYLRLGQNQEAQQLLAASLLFLEEHLHAEGLQRWLALVSGSLTPPLLVEAAAYFRRYWNVPRAA
jgi:tetratricopeptide (TPR) repeat protein